MTELAIGSIQTNLGDATLSIPFTAKRSGELAVSSIFTMRPGARIAHLRIAPVEEHRWGWGEFLGCGFTRGEIINLVDGEIGSLCATFLPGVKLASVGVRYDVSNTIAGGEDKVVLFALLGHMDLFGTHGVVRHSTDSLMRPHLHVQQAVEAGAHELRLLIDQYWGPLQKGVVAKVTQRMMK